MFGIPSVSTVNEYKSLKASQKPVDVKTTSRELDEYVYSGKSGVASNVLLTLSAAAVNGAFIVECCKNLQNSKKALNGWHFLGLLIFDALLIAACKKMNYEQNKVLSSPENKQALYKRKGLNAVI